MTRFLSFSFFRTYAAWLFMPVLGIVFGALAASANPLTIGIGISSFIGILLLRKPVWNVNLVIVLGLLSGLMPLFFDKAATKLSWGISILGFILLFAALYKLITKPHLIKSTPLFVWIALLFLLYTILDSALQLYSAKEAIGGFKRYFQVWGLLFGLSWLDFNKKNIDQWCAIILIICLLQVPFCLYELIFLVPIRESYVHAYPGLVPIDIVAGTFGARLKGGGSSAEMSIVLIMVFVFLVARYRENVMTGKKLFLLSLLLLSPLFMGETKIVAIFFPLAFAILYRKKLLTRPHYLIAALILGGVFLTVVINIYMIINKHSLDELIFGALKYNVYEVGYGGFYLNRTTVLTFWAQHQSLAADPLSFLFGNGLGSAEVSGSDGGGHIDMLYPNYGIGFIGATILLWEQGVFGVGLFLLMIILVWHSANRLITQTDNPVVRADAAAIQTSIVLFSLHPFYKDGLFVLLGFQLIFTAMLGYLAWMYRQHITCKV